MAKFRSIVMWFGLILIVLLIFLSVWGAFLGSAGAWNLFNSLPLAVFWFFLVIAMGVGLVGLGKRSDRLSLQLIHLGCILVIAAAMYGSQTGHNIRESIFGAGKIRKGMMLLHQGQQSNEVELKDSGTTVRLAFEIKLKAFRIEHYQPEYLYIKTSLGDDNWKIPVETGGEIYLGERFGKVKIARRFENFKISFDNGSSIVTDSNQPGSNPALEIQIEHTDGRTETRYVFERFSGHVHPEDKFLFSYRRMVSDYISELAVIKDGRVVKEKAIEVNRPLHFGGYYFYQHSYDDQAGQYSIIEVVSDSGLYVVYAGYLMLIAGIFQHFWLRRLFNRRVNN